MKNMQTLINIDQNWWTPWTKDNQWKSKKFEIPKQFIRGHTANINIIYTKGFHVLQATSCRLQATGGRLQATGNSLQARSNRAARSFRLQARGHRRQATSYRLQATGYKHHVLGLTLEDHFGMLAGFRKRWFRIAYVAKVLRAEMISQSMWDR
jgi:hypothetical protein